MKGISSSTRAVFLTLLSLALCPIFARSVVATRHGFYFPLPGEGLDKQRRARPTAARAGQ